MSETMDPLQPSDPDDRPARAMSIQFDLDDADIASQRSKHALRLTLGAVALSSLGTVASVWGSGLWFAIAVFTVFATFSTLALLSDILGWRPFTWIPVGLRSARTAPMLPLEQALEALPEVEYIDLVQPMGDPTLGGFPVVPLGDGLFAAARIPSPLETEAFDYRDILVLEELEEGKYVLRGIHARSGWVRYDALLSGEVAVSDALRVLLEEVSARGGLWMQYFGGCLAVSMPPDSDWDFNDKLHLVTVSSTPAP